MPTIQEKQIQLHLLLCRRTLIFSITKKEKRVSELDEELRKLGWRRATRRRGTEKVRGIVLREEDFLDLQKMARGQRASLIKKIAFHQGVCESSIYGKIKKQFGGFGSQSSNQASKKD